ncbi:hypothetical protein, partial [Streptomyces sp. NPDC059016]|uniref:hypothetical protein n=1 Tax=Streptomyces sp. NPDC059016 TaxID=3346699 RepID=UPI0036B3459F
RAPSGIGPGRRAEPAGRPPPRSTCAGGAPPPATRGYEQGHRAWRRYARDLRLAVIPGGRHYFAKHLPDRLAALLADLHRNGGTHV